jgi:N6-adenosine-specific RNA methylase IME4
MRVPLREEFRCVLIDPPWLERGGGRIKRGANRHYALMRRPQIAEAIKGCGHWDRIASNAHLWLWYTDNHLPDALELVKELGFEYKRTFQWIKIRVDSADHVVLTRDAHQRARPSLRTGIGQYARGAHEGLILATRGRGTDPSVMTELRNIPSVIVAGHTTTHDRKPIHSAKPRESYELIELRSKGPRLELFARVSRPGWTTWGNEVDI